MSSTPSGGAKPCSTAAFLKSAASVGALGVSAIPATADPFALSDHGDSRTYEIRTVVEIDSTEAVRV